MSNPPIIATQKEYLEYVEYRQAALSHRDMSESPVIHTFIIAQRIYDYLTLGLHKLVDLRLAIQNHELYENLVAAVLGKS